MRTQNPLLVYQAPWDWDDLWNRAQPLAQALSTSVTVLYLNCGVQASDVMRGCARLPGLRRPLTEQVHWGQCRQVSPRLFVHQWFSAAPKKALLYAADHPPWSYRYLAARLKLFALNHHPIWLLTSKPRARGLLGLRRWDRMLVDIEDPWLEYHYSSSEDRAPVVEFLRAADVVFANGSELAHRYQAIAGREVVDFPNGIDANFVAAAADDSGPCPPLLARSSRTRVVYAGQTDQRLDLPLLLHVVQHCPQVDFFFIGNHQLTGQPEWDTIAAQPNVVVVPRIAHGELARVLAHAQVLLIPFIGSRGVTSMFPAKLYEYVATGKPIATTSAFGLQPPWPPTLTLCRTPDEMVRCIQRVARKEWTVTGEMRAACRRIAATNDWQRRAQSFLQRVNDHGEIPRRAAA